MLIFSFLQFLFSFILNILTWWLPTASELPYGIAPLLASAFGGYHALAIIFPFMDHAMNLIIFGFGVVFASFLYRLIKLIVNFLRGSGA